MPDKNEKNISARVIHKHDIEANWNKAVNFIPKSAEIIVYDVDDNYSYPRLKIGDGICTVTELPFVVDKNIIDTIFTTIKFDDNKNVLLGDTHSNITHETGILNTVEGTDNYVGISRLPAVKMVQSDIDNNTITFENYTDLISTEGIGFGIIILLTKIVKENNLDIYKIYQYTVNELCDIEGNPHIEYSDTFSADNIYSVHIDNNLLVELYSEILDSNNVPEYINFSNNSFTINNRYSIMNTNSFIYTGELFNVSNSHVEGLFNTAISPITHIEGKYNIAGSRAYRILGLDKANECYELNDVTGIAIGDIYSIRLYDEYIDNGEIIEVINDIENNKKYVKVTNFIYENGLVEGIDINSNTLYNSFRIVEKPWLGTFDIGYNSHAEGELTRSLGAYSHTEGKLTRSVGRFGHAEGFKTNANYIAHAEGYYTTASGDSSHAEGYGTKASGNYGAHAEGNQTTAIGNSSHAEGVMAKAGLRGYYYSNIDFDNKTITLTTIQGTTSEPFTISAYAIGDVITLTDNNNLYYDCATIVAIDNNLITVDKLPFETIVFPDTYESWMCNFYVSLKCQVSDAGESACILSSYAHAEGNRTKAFGISSHAEGRDTIASGYNSHAEGRSTEASGNYSHAEGYKSYASGKNSHAEGSTTEASGNYSHAEGNDTTASGESSHAEGYRATASGTYSHGEGYKTTASGDYAHAEGGETKAIGNYSHGEGYKTTASGGSSHAEGRGTEASGAYSHSEGRETKATNKYSHAEGYITEASGEGSHAEGNETKAIGNYSHGEGYKTTASGAYSHSEGRETKATNKYSHAEGYITEASGESSHTEGRETKATGYNSHAEGYSTEASGNESHAEGRNTIASGDDSHAEGYSTEASGSSSHAEGDNTKAINRFSHAEGGGTTASGDNGAHAEGFHTKAFGSSSHAEGAGTEASGVESHAEGSETTASGAESHAEGSATIASGNVSHAEGYITEASGNYGAHAEGESTVASGNSGAHAEGYGTEASGDSSHAEGFSTTASDYYSHAEGNCTTASGVASHAEGQNTTASGDFGAHAEGYGTEAHGNYGAHAEGYCTKATAYSHAEGYCTKASGSVSHAEGGRTTASGAYSHAEGLGTIASGVVSHVEGKYNIEDTENKYAHIVGNGTDVDNRSNAHTLDWDGNAWYAGKINGMAIDYLPVELSVDSYFIQNESPTPQAPQEIYFPTNIKYVEITENEVSEGNSENTFNTDIPLKSKFMAVSDEYKDSLTLKNSGLYHTKRIKEFNISSGEWAATSTSNVYRVNLITDKYFDSDFISKYKNKEIKKVFETAGLSTIGTYVGTGTPKSNGEFTIGSTSSNIILKLYDDTIADKLNSKKTNVGELLGGFTLYMPLVLDLIEEPEETSGSEIRELYDYINKNATSTLNTFIKFSDNSDNDPNGQTVLANIDRTINIGKEIDSINDKIIKLEENNGGESGSGSSITKVSTKAYLPTEASEGDMIIVTDDETSNYNGLYLYINGSWCKSDTEGYNTMEFNNVSLVLDKSFNVTYEETIDNDITTSYIKLPIDNFFTDNKVIAFYLYTTPELSYGHFTINVLEQIEMEDCLKFKIDRQLPSDMDLAEVDFKPIVYNSTDNIHNTQHTEGDGTAAVGYGSHAEGKDTIASGYSSHAEGNQTTAFGHSSHAEGYITEASGDYSHAEGRQTRALSKYSHAEGNHTTASGDYGVHAEGSYTTASGRYSHAEGYGTEASGDSSHAEGFNTTASGDNGAHAEGNNTEASGNYSHAEGSSTIASGNYSHAEGSSTIASGNYSHAEGSSTKAFGVYSHAEGYNTKSGCKGYYYSDIDFETNTITLTNVQGGTPTEAFSIVYSVGDVITISDANRSYINCSKITAKDNNIITVDKLPFNSINFPVLSEMWKCNIFLAAAPLAGPCILGFGTHAEGIDTVATSSYSHVEGYNTHAYGNASHAEGYSTTASGYNSHAEGYNTKAYGDRSHSEGYSTTASGFGSHAEGDTAKAGGSSSHAEGGHTTASGDFSHAECSQTKALGKYSHAEGCNTEASGDNSHSEGETTTASGNYSHTEGYFTIASGTSSHAEGDNTTASGTSSHAEGRDTIASGTHCAHAEGGHTTASGNYGAHAEGYYTTASGTSSHAEGYETTASGTYSAHAEGSYTTASGDYSHAEGYNTTASGESSHAEGYGTGASGNYGAHAEGYKTNAGIRAYYYSNVDFENKTITLSTKNATTPTEPFTIGYSVGDIVTIVTNSGTYFRCATITDIDNNIITVDKLPFDSINISQIYVYYIYVISKPDIGIYSIGESSHAEGSNTISSGFGSHAEGSNTRAFGGVSHTEGKGTVAYGNYSHVEGKYNIEDTENKYAHIVGNGEDDENRSNAHTLDWDGNAWYAGNVETSAIILRSSTPGSTKKFIVTVDDNGTLTTTPLE